MRPITNDPATAATIVPIMRAIFTPRRLLATPTSGDTSPSTSVDTEVLTSRISGAGVDGLVFDTAAPHEIQKDDPLLGAPHDVQNLLMADLDLLIEEWIGFLRTASHTEFLFRLKRAKSRL